MPEEVESQEVSLEVDVLAGPILPEDNYQAREGHKEHINKLFSKKFDRIQSLDYFKPPSQIRPTADPITSLIPPSSPRFHHHLPSALPHQPTECTLPIPEFDHTAYYTDLTTTYHMQPIRPYQTPTSNLPISHHHTPPLTRLSLPHQSRPHRLTISNHHYPNYVTIINDHHSPPDHHHPPPLIITKRLNPPTRNPPPSIPTHHKPPSPRQSSPPPKTTSQIHSSYPPAQCRDHTTHHPPPPYNHHRSDVYRAIQPSSSMNSHANRWTKRKDTRKLPRSSATGLECS
nr:extensin-like [Penaeus vannamei]